MGSCSIHNLGHTQLALFRHKSWSSGFLAACSASGVLAACREQQDLNRGVVMRGSIVPGDGRHNPVDGDLVNAAAAKSHLWRPAQFQGLGFRGLARLTGAHSFSVNQVAASSVVCASVRWLGSRFWVLFCCRTCSVPQCHWHLQGSAGRHAVCWAADECTWLLSHYSLGVAEDSAAQRPLLHSHLQATVHVITRSPGGQNLWSM